MTALLCCLYAFTELSTLVVHDNPLPLDRPAVVNPYATLGIGWELELRRTTFYAQLKHTSGVRVHDQGDDALMVGTRIYFGSRQ